MDNKKVFVVIGGKWFDKVNGNTYNSAKIIDTESGNRFYTRFTYGYGSAYLSEARDFIRTELNQDGARIIDGGSFFGKKSEIKNGQF